MVSHVPHLQGLLQFQPRVRTPKGTAESISLPQPPSSVLVLTEQLSRESVHLKLLRTDFSEGAGKELKWLLGLPFPPLLALNLTCSSSWFQPHLLLWVLKVYKNPKQQHSVRKLWTALPPNFIISLGCSSKTPSFPSQPSVTASPLRLVVVPVSSIGHVAYLPVPYIPFTSSRSLHLISTGCSCMQLSRGGERKTIR